MTEIFPFVSVKTRACKVEKAFEWVPARAESTKSVIMQFSLKSVLLGTNQIAGSARDFNMNMIKHSTKHLLDCGALLLFKRVCAKLA